jgi:hypothetical protein
MKGILTIIFMTLFVQSYSKEKSFAIFYFNQQLDTSRACAAPWDWTINGTLLSDHKKEYYVNIHFPDFDTLLLSRQSGERRIIVTRFNPNHKYQLRPQGCCHDIDVFDEEKIKEYQNLFLKVNDTDYSDDVAIWKELDSLYQYNEIGNVKFKLINSTKTDSIAGTFGDIDRAINMTSGNLLIDNKIIDSDSPFMYGESNFCFEIVLGRVKNIDLKLFDFESTDLYFYYDEGMVYQFIEQFTSFEYRFFNRETILITFDAKKKGLKLKII